MSTILIVDDNEQNLYLLRTLLGGKGYTVEEARNGQEALDRAQQAPPDLIISDILMPVLDGFALCRRWRSDEALRDIPFVFYTATYTDPKDEELALGLGAARFIIKPAEPNEFLGILEKVLYEHGQGQVVAPHEHDNDDVVYYQKYNQALVHKLESKMLELERANRALEAEVRERQRAEGAERRSREVSEAIARSSLRFLETGSKPAMAQVVVEHAVRLSGARIGVLIEVDPGQDGPGGQILAASEMAWSTIKGTQLYEEARRLLREKGRYPIAVSDSLIFQPFHRGETVVSHRPSEEQVWLGTQPEGHPVIDSFLGVPLKVGDQVLGMIAVANCPEGFNTQTCRDLEALATTAALALLMARAEEHRVAAEARLRQGQKMEAVGKLAGGIAHDFNNLLQVVLGYGEVVLDALDPSAPVRSEMEQVYGAAERAAELTRQLLTFSRQQESDPTDLDLNEVIGTLVKLLHRIIGEDVEVAVIMGQALSLVHADPGQIEQMLMNLVLNARDAMQDGGRLTIETENVFLDEEYHEAHSWAKPGRYVLLIVTDSGVGIEPEVLPRIYEPFFTTKPPGEGTGLGLATVHGIVKQHKGLIHVYSEPGLGTTFKVYLPVVEEPAAAAREPVEGPPSGGTETILLAEDEEGVRQLTTRFLETAGYTVLSASNGEEALRVLEDCSEQIDLALIDVVMPRLGGREVVRRIRTRWPEMKVLLTTGYGVAGWAPEHAADEPVGVVTKPYGYSTILRKVRNCLDA